MPVRCGFLGQEPEHGTRRTAGNLPRRVRIFNAPYAPGDTLGRSRSASCDSHRQDAPKARGLQAGGVRQDGSPRHDGKTPSGCDETAEFRKSFTASGGQRRSRQRIVRMRDYSPRTAKREARRLAASRRQHRPIRRALCLFCTGLACLLLLVASPSISIAAGIPAKAFRCGAQKAAGQSAGLEGLQCRTRIAGEAPPPGSAGLLEPFEAVSALPAKAGAVPASASVHRIDTRRPATAGARAPPVWRIPA